MDGADIVLCESCLNGMVILSGTGCLRCGSPDIEDSGECRTCSRLDPELAQVRSAVWFTGPVPQLIHCFKYRGIHRPSSFCAEVMAALPWTVEFMDMADILIPVPLHRWHELRRGYNQSEKTARAMACLFGKEITVGALVRTRRTRSQTRLTVEERRANVAGAFSVKDPSRVAGRTVLLFDDVMTTGATLNACAVTLKKAGAEKIIACTFARA